MTELSLIFSIALVTIAFAAGLGRWTLSQPPGSHELGRLLSAVQRAADAFLWRENQLIAVGVIVLLPVVAALYALAALGASPPRHSPWQSAMWAGTALVIGALMTVFIAHLSTQLTLRAAARTADAARNDVNQAVTVALRGGFVVALVTEASSLLVVGSMFAMLCGTGTGQETIAFGDLLQRTVVMPALAIGAVWAALVIQSAGTTFQAAGDVGSIPNDDQDESDSERNPALVASLMGVQIGSGAAVAVDAFVVTTLANITCVMMAIAVVGANAVGFSAGFSIISLPLVLRTLGLIASTFGVMATRADATSDARAPTAALWRGHITAVTVSLGGMAGACLWLIGGQGWAAFYLGGALGLLSASAASHLTRYRLVQRVSVLRGGTPEDKLTFGETVIAHGLGLGMSVLLIPAAVVGLSLVGTWALGTHSGMNRGGLLALAVAMAGMLSTQSYVYAVGTFHPIADSARVLARLKLSQLSEEAQRRATRVDSAGFAGASVARTYAICAGSVAALLSALTLPLVGPGELTPIDLTQPAVLWSGILGSGLVLSYAGRALRRSSRAANAVRQEVLRQLKSPNAQAVAPSYRSSIQIATDTALHRLPLRVLTPLFATGLVGVCLRVSFAPEATLALEGLMAFTAIATVTGFGAALAADGARAVLGRLRRLQRSGDPVPANVAVSGHAFATFVGGSAGPAAQLVIKAVAIVCLALMVLFQSTP